VAQSDFRIPNVVGFNELDRIGSQSRAEVIEDAHAAYELSGLVGMVCEIAAVRVPVNLEGADAQTDGAYSKDAEPWESSPPRLLRALPLTAGLPFGSMQLG
jgi:hypothetical protein